MKSRWTINLLLLVAIIILGLIVRYEPGIEAPEKTQAITGIKAGQVHRIHINRPTRPDLVLEKQADKQWLIVRAAPVPADDFKVRAIARLAEQKPAKNRFAGKVYILADGGSFSTTADFVSIARNSGAATVIGQETGGGACGNTSGNNKSITLSNSGIKVQIQMWGYSSAINKDLPCGHGVMPDYKVVDLPFTENDEMMEMVATLKDKS